MGARFECMLCGKVLSPDEEVGGWEEFVICNKCAKELPDPPDDKEDIRD